MRGLLGETMVAELRYCEGRSMCRNRSKDKEKRVLEKAGSPRLGAWSAGAKGMPLVILCRWGSGFLVEQMHLALEY